MEKADFLYFEFKTPNGISLIMFRDCSVTFSAKIKKNKKNKKKKGEFLSNNPFNASKQRSQLAHFP